MFGSNGKEMKGPMAVDNNVLNTIARGTVLEGKIITKGDIRVEGKVIGIITCDAKLVIGEHGVVEGQIDARNAYIAGEVRGTVVVRELLQLQERGKIEGDIFTQKLSVQVGATFTGNCRMGKDAEVPAVDSTTENTFMKGPKKVVFNGGDSDSPKSSFLNGPKEASL
jgi:cytoskeletal protein CcmA (bactofilin family)